MSKGYRKKAIVVLASGAEEIETVTVIDLLRRAEVHVIVAGLGGPYPVTCSHRTVIMPEISLSDSSIESAEYFDAVVLPGGDEASNLIADSLVVKGLLQKQEEAGKIIAAICAAPIALKNHEIARGYIITSHPSKAREIKASGLYTYSEDRVVVDGNVVASRGPGTAMEFGLQLVRMLAGDHKAREIAESYLVKHDDFPKVQIIYRTNESRPNRTQAPSRTSNRLNVNNNQAQEPREGAESSPQLRPK